MKHSQFSIGKEFYCGSGKWLCTDIGTRTIVAISLEPGRDKSWFIGPPYPVLETVFDENDLPACSEQGCDE